MVNNNISFIYWACLHPDDYGPINHVKDFISAIGDYAKITRIIAVTNNREMTGLKMKKQAARLETYTINTKLNVVYQLLFYQMVSLFVFVKLLLIVRGKKVFYLRYCSFLFLPLILKIFRVKNVFLEINGMPNQLLLEKKKNSSVDYLRKKILFYFDKALFEMVDQLLAVCPNFRDNIVNNYKVKKSIAVIPNGYILQNIRLLNKAQARLKLGLGGNKIYCIYIGALAHHEGIEFLVEAFLKWLSLTGDDKMGLLILGGGDLLRNHKFLSNIKSSKNIVYVGRVARDRMREYLAAADIGVYTPPEVNYNKDRQRGGSPLKIVDYLSSGCPVLVPESKYYEYVEQNKLGALFKPGDVESFCASLKTLTQNQEKLAELGNNAKAYAEKHLQWKTTLSGLFEVIEKI